MVRLVKQIQCPKCASMGKDNSKDNLAVYSDGHKYCYSCHYYESAGGVEKFLSKQELTKEEDKHKVYLPHDCDVNYPYNVLKWVEGYELTKNDLLTHGILWSQEKSRLIFPIYGGEGELIAWQGRWFGTEENTKWYGLGNLKDTYNILGRSSPVVLVEDIISAIKVSRYTSAMPLYGSNIGPQRFKRLLSLLGYKAKVIIWLDKDKQTEAIKESRLGSFIGLDTSVIITDLDPKEIKYEEIKELLND